LSKLDQIRALGECEMARRFGAPTVRKPVPEIADVDTPRKRGRPRKADSARSGEAAYRCALRAKRRLYGMIPQAQGYGMGRPRGVSKSVANRSSDVRRSEPWLAPSIRFARRTHSAISLANSPGSTSVI
jgi:hypothetical protein